MKNWRAGRTSFKRKNFKLEIDSSIANIFNNSQMVPGKRCLNKVLK